MSNDERARRRLLIYSLVRLAGVALFFLGVAVMYTGLLRKGGWPQLGAILVIAGVLAGLLLPRFVKRGWDRRE